jgi:enoyl-CoA hydratase/carnithine racemase
MSATAADVTPTGTTPGSAVRVELDGPTAVVTLDNPKRRNALSVATMTELTAALRDVAAHEGVRAIVLRAEGPAFSAGHDLSEMVDRTLDEEREVFAVCTDLMSALHQVPQPVIAAVQGVAVAAGCQLVAACDLAVAADTAVFGTPGVKIGLFCSTPMVAVTRAIGRKRAMQLLLTGETIDAATAVDWGLVNQVVAPAELDAIVRALAAKVTDASAVTLRIGKEAFYRQIELPEDDAYEQMRETMATNAMTCDAQEGMSAFLAKRAPNWHHHE